MQPEEQCPHAAWNCTHSRASGSFLESPPHWPSPRPGSSPEERGAPLLMQRFRGALERTPAASETQSSGRLFGLKSVLKWFELVVDLQQVSYQNPDLGGVFFIFIFNAFDNVGPQEQSRARAESSPRPAVPGSAEAPLPMPSLVPAWLHKSRELAAPPAVL